MRPSGRLHLARPVSHPRPLRSWSPVKWLVGYVDPRKPDDDPLHEWFFRSGLDRYVWIYGMACAYCHPTCERWLEQLHTMRGHKRLASKAAVLGVVAGVGGLWFTQVYQLPKLEYNKVHPYTSWIPITLWCVLRNLLPQLRTYYLEFFAYMGKITLETYICQFHIWLHTGKSDAQPAGLLVLVPGYPLTNFLCTTLLYVFVSRRVFEATNTLKNACVPLTDNALLYSNLAAAVALALSLYIAGLLLQLL